MANVNVHGEFEKGLVGLAMIFCAIAFGYSAAVFGWMNPWAAAGIAAVVGAAFAYQSKKNAGITIFVALIVLLAAMYR